MGGCGGSGALITQGEEPPGTITTVMSSKAKDVDPESSAVQRKLL